MVTSEVIKTELGMVLMKKEAGGEAGARRGVAAAWRRARTAFVVRGPVSQEKVFTDRKDAERYFSYYVERCRREN